MFDQSFVGEMSAESIEELKGSQGGDWQSTVTDWCNNMVSNFKQNNDIPGTAVPYLTSTWRIEGGKANCYVRTMK
jgi:hypothetical protein